jgi:hypothetical protein
MVLDLLSETAKKRGLETTLAMTVITDHRLRGHRGAVQVRRS